MVVIVDEPKARTRRRTFNYVREGCILRHISKYATKLIKEGDNRAWRIFYEVPYRKISSKWIYELGFTNNGGFTASKYRAEELAGGKPKHIIVDREELRQLKIEVRDKTVQRLKREVQETYDPMIREVKEFAGQMGIEVIASERLGDWLRDMNLGLKSNLCFWPEEARAESIKATSKLAYQMWVFMLTHKALGCRGVKKNWLLELGSKYPASVFLDEKNRYWTGWWEPQRISKAPPAYKGRLCNFFKGRVVWKRPDMIFSIGRYETLVDAPEFNILVECKNFEFIEWWENGRILEEELVPYMQLFRPQLFVLASLCEVPEWAKNELEEKGIVVVDKLHIDGERVREFFNLLVSEFGI